MVINLCDCDIATNFSVVAEEVILVDSCAMIVIYFVKKKKQKKEKQCCLWYRAGTVQVLFKTEVLVELGLDILFLERKRHSEQD